VRAIHGAAGLGGVEGPAGAVRVQGPGQAEGAEHMRESMHHGLQALARPELRVEQPLGGVIEDGDQGLPLGRLQRQPRLRAAIEMQQFTVARPRLRGVADADRGRGVWGPSRRLVGRV